MKIREFFKTSLIGGLLVLLPLGLLLFVFQWAFNLIRNLIGPITVVFVKLGMPTIIADVIVIVIIIVFCFFVGIFVKTRFGGWMYLTLETNLLKKAPGYSLIKETVNQFIGKNKSPFSSVALANIFANEVLVTAFVTDEHADGSFTVFVPTGPNPTSGNIFHLSQKCVHKIDVPVEIAMKSIISCGAGSADLVKKYSEGKTA